MLARLRSAGLVWPTLTLIPALALLIGLGGWQWQRLAWKNSLIAQIESRTKAEPVALTEAIRRFRAGEDIDYLRVRVRGRFDHSTERFLYMPGESGGGTHVYTRLETEGGGLLLVNRGFVTDAVKPPASRPAGQIEGPTEVVGLVRKPQPPGAFTPPSDPVRNLYFYADYAGMLGPPVNGLSPVPFFVDADATPNPGGWPQGGVTRVVIPNRHFEYALTWWSFAASLIGVYGVFAWGRIKMVSREW